MDLNEAFEDQLRIFEYEIIQPYDKVKISEFLLQILTDIMKKPRPYIFPQENEFFKY